MSTFKKMNSANKTFIVVFSMMALFMSYQTIVNLIIG